jgi:GntR family transcriptional regulator, rspAB operon transcriptional repressor
MEGKLANRASRGRDYRSFLASPNPLVQPHSLAPGPAATLSEKVYRALKRDIIRGVYQPGDALSEKDLTERYKGSRTPVREAAVRLQNERLLRIVPNRGYFVSPITLQVLNDIYEFRAAVESAAAELAAAKGANSELLKKLAQLAVVTCAPEDRKSCMSFIEADTAFHVGIARLARNQMLLQAVSEARNQMERIMYAAIDIHYYGELPGREHREILQAIRERDPERARQRMHNHIMQSKDKVLGVTNSMVRNSSN